MKVRDVCHSEQTARATTVTLWLRPSHGEWRGSHVRWLTGLFRLGGHERGIPVTLPGDEADHAAHANRKLQITNRK